MTRTSLEQIELEAKAAMLLMRAAELVFARAGAFVTACHELDHDAAGPVAQLAMRAMDYAKVRGGHFEFGCSQDYRRAAEAIGRSVCA